MGEPLFCENGIHEATLQRLGTYLQNGTKNVFYSPDSFNPSQWEGIPVIYADVPAGQPLRHPPQEAVIGGTLPAGYRVVGTTKSPSLSDQGEPALRAQIEFHSEAADIETMANGGELSLSTGFSGGTIPEPDGRHRLVGATLPNHVLVFRRGACPNCYPNDNGAVFHNCMESESMTETNEGLLKSMKEFFTVSRNEIQVENAAELKVEIEKLRAENAALVSRIDANEAARQQEIKDSKWATFRNALPAGWLGEKEADTRARFESDPGALALKLIEFQNAQPATKGAQGNTTHVEPLDAENAAEAEIAEFQKKFGIKFIGDE